MNTPLLGSNKQPKPAGQTGWLSKQTLPHLGAATLGRISSGAMPITLFIALSKDHGYGAAAAVDAAYTLVIALLAPLRGRVIDRTNARVAIPVMAFVSFSSLIASVVLLLAGLPLGAIGSALLVSALTSPPIDSAIRVNWRRLVRAEDLKKIHTVDSQIDEVGFIAGPAFASLLFIVAGPSHAFSATVVVATLGATLFILNAWRTGVFQATVLGADDQPPARSSSWIGTLLGPLALGRMWLILLPLAAMGLMFGGLGIYVPAFSDATNNLAFSGIVISAISVGGLLGGFIFGWIRLSVRPVDQHFVLTGGFLVASVLIFLGNSLGILAGVLFFMGLFVTPIYISAYLLIDSSIPEDQRYEANVWVGSITDLANAAAAISIGIIIAGTNWSLGRVFMSGLALLLLGALCVFAYRYLLPRRNQQAMPEGEHVA